LTASIHDDPLLPDSPGVLHHQKANGGNEKLARGLAPHFPDPATIEDWHFFNQLNQARAITFGIEHLRSHRGTCMGTVVWQLNDCWPVTSWAAIDGAGRLKPLWYALRRAYDSRLVTVQPRSDGLHVFVVNEEAAAWASRLDVRRIDLDGVVLARWTADITAGPRSSADVVVPDDIGTPVDPLRELLVVSAGDRDATWFYAEDKDIDYPAADFDVEVIPKDDGHVVRVTTRNLVRDLALFADRIHADAEVDTMLVTLFPGQSHDFHVRGAADLTVAQVTAPAVLRCANDSSRSTV
jgi:beta-mannosidase